MTSPDDLTLDLSALDAVGQAELVRRGAISPVELVQAAIDRIEVGNADLNAVISRRYEKALAEARLISRARAAPFAGVPILLKDALCHTAGDPYHFGMQALKDIGWIEKDDTNLARRFRQAGFLILGKTNTPELAGSTTTEPLAYGPTRNPWNRDRSPMGSSGGSAAAVAAGFVPLAHGNDMGGSIRMPAAACGLVGLKPSRGRVSQGPEFAEYYPPLTSEHVLTRSVRDSAAVLDCISGYEAGDPHAAAPPISSFRAAAEQDPPSLRIGLVELPASIGVDDSAIQAVAGIAALAEALGHRVDPVTCPTLWAAKPSSRLRGVGRRHEIARLSRRIGRTIELSEVEPATAYLAELGREVSADEYLTAQEERQLWGRRVVAEWRAQCDVLLLPTLIGPPPQIGVLAPDSTPPEDLLRRSTRESVLAWVFNVTGEPAISLPVARSPDGLPIGIQLVAPYASDGLLLALAGQIERALPWAGTFPAREMTTSG
jgi:amidase